jgi:hypothetical protein
MSPTRVAEAGRPRVSAARLRSSARGIATFLLYAALAIGLTWPLAAHVETHLPNTAGPSATDVPYIAWALAWQSHALATNPTRYLDANIYHPASRALLYGDPGIAALPVFAPVFLETGNPTLAINLVLIAGIALTAWSLHYVVELWTRSWLAGLVGASTFLTNAWAIPGFFGWAPTYAILCYLPFVAYLAARPIARLDDAVALALLVALQASGNMVYVAASTIAPVGTLTAIRLARPRTRAAGIRLASVLLLAGVVLAPVYLEYASIRSENVALGRQSAWAPIVKGADKTATVLAPERVARALPEALLWRLDSTWLAPSLLVLIVVGGVAAWRRREARAGTESLWRHALLWTGIGLLLATSRIAVGGTSVLLPHYWLLERAAPFANAILREDRRLGLPCVVGFALLAGAALVAIGRVVPARFARGARALAAAAALAGAVVSHAAHATPMGITEVPRPNPLVREMLAATDGPLLELPVRPFRIVPREHVDAMYRSIGHWRPLLNGYSSYWPEGFPERMAMAARVPDDAAVEQLVRETGLSVVIVDLARCTDKERFAWLLRANKGAVGRLHLAARAGTELLFLVDRRGIE